MSADVEKMACMEVWGGISATWSSFVVPGLDLWVHSKPYHGNEAGGDVYYLSSCASGRITRMLIGDVSGHGKEAAPVASRLRDIMRRNVNFVTQSRVVQSVNDQFEEAESTGRFATAIISTYYAPRRSLEVCLAGHPPPLIYRRRSRKWEVLNVTDADRSSHNMPMGVMEGQRFASIETAMEPDDMLLSYTDALFESRDASEEMLQAEGLRDVVAQLNTDQQPSVLIPRLLDKLKELNPENLSEDDVTVLLARANTQTPRFVDYLLAPFRVIQGLLGLG